MSESILEQIKALDSEETGFVSAAGVRQILNNSDWDEDRINGVFRDLEIGGDGCAKYVDVIRIVNSA